MDKEVAEVIREQRKKEREETKKRRATYSHNVIDKATQRLLEKLYKTYFNQAWSTLAIRETCDKFH